MKLAGFLMLLAAALHADKIYVYSPLTRIAPSGEVVKPDRGTRQPRHILSPGVPRNGYSSFRVVVELDKPGGYYLDIGQNPENSVAATLYRENWIETPEGYIPDTLTKVSIPYQGFATDFRLPGQRVVSFWLDMRVDAKAEVDRVKVEPQLWPESIKDWIVYPMEVRIQQPVIPPSKGNALPTLPPLTAPADSVAHPFVAQMVCGVQTTAAKTDEPGQTTGRQLLRRNIAQHVALSASVEDLKAMFTKASGFIDVQGWCKKPVTSPSGPEWYLRFRDMIFRAAGAQD